MEIPVLQNVLKANDTIAADNKEFLKIRNIFSVNMISSPGAGKTTILEQTLQNAESSKLKISVIEGDLATSLDAERVGKYNRPVLQINTGGGCHLDASQVKKALESEFISDDTNLLVIENVGNLVCPASYKLGEDKKVIILSITEGDDKPIKYPSIFTRADIVLINKIDLLELCDFDMEKVYRDITSLNADAKVIEMSAKTGQGFDEWISWLESHVK